jgi:DNA-directed RNA polymerase I subunit RPA43
VTNYLYLLYWNFQHPGEGVAVVARELGKIWATITVEEKEGYQQQAAQERARVALELEAWTAAGGVAELPAFKSDGGLILPVARIRKICKLDPEVRNLSKEALLLVTKAAELMTAKLAAETVRVAQIQNRRKLLPDDVAQVCSSREQFVFLRDDIQDLAREAKVAAAANSNSKGSKSKGAASADGEPVGKPLTAYFAVKPK